MEHKDYDYKGFAANGFAMLLLNLVVLPALVLAVVMTAGEAVGIAAMVVGALAVAVCLGGYFTQEPNECRVILFFGKYCGTFHRTGFFWINPFKNRKRLSLRLRNMDIDPIKVNDKVGNPVLIGMVLVWTIDDTYRAVFDVDAPITAGNQPVDTHTLNQFVAIQSDAALREVTGRYAYDNTDGGHHDEITLRGGGEEINDLLERKINERLHMAGIRVVEARLNYLAYAPEIAAVMLRRQQAAAIITAREKIVEGAVSMVKMALERLEHDQVATFTPESKAAMVGNLMVVLCSDESAQPVLNTGN